MGALIQWRYLRREGIRANDLYHVGRWVSVALGIEHGGNRGTISEGAVTRDSC